MEGGVCGQSQAISDAHVLLLFCFNALLNAVNVTRVADRSQTRSGFKPGRRDKERLRIPAGMQIETDLRQEMSCSVCTYQYGCGYKALVIHAPSKEGRGKPDGTRW